MSAYPGPRPACTDLTSLSDDIYNLIEPIVNDMLASDEERVKANKAISDAIVNVFCDEKVDKIRSYIYDLWRTTQEGELNAPK